MLQVPRMCSIYNVYNLFNESTILLNKRIFFWLSPIERERDRFGKQSNEKQNNLKSITYDQMFEKTALNFRTVYASHFNDSYDNQYGFECVCVCLCVAVSMFHTCEHVWMKKAAYGREIKWESERTAWVCWSWEPYQNQISRTFRFRSCTNPVECVATVQVFNKNRYKCRCTHSRIYNGVQDDLKRSTIATTNILRLELGRRKKNTNKKLIKASENDGATPKSNKNITKTKKN